MTMIGQTNRLKILRITDSGAVLDGGKSGLVHLPKQQVPRGAKVGEILEAFVYPDADQLIATTDHPYAEVGDTAFLKVLEVNDIGAFLDWGIGKNLFVPFAEQPIPMKPGSRYVVHVYLDNTGRVAASMKIKKFMGKITPEYTVGDEVDLIVVRSTELGWEAVVDNEFLGMIFMNDTLGQCKVGAKLVGYIKDIREGGLVDLSLQPPNIKGVDLSQQVLDFLKKNGGTSTLTDKSSPDEIFKTFGVSKRVYKDALGALYRKRLIELEPNLVKLAKR